VGSQERIVSTSLGETRRESGAWKAKHARILSAALDEFVAKGFTGASMDRIAQKAKVSKVTIYNHFENKDLLYRQMVEHFLTTVHTGLPELPALLAGGVAATRDALVEYGRQLIEVTSQTRTLGMIRLLRAERAPGATGDARAEARLLPEGRVLAQFIERVVRAGRLACDNALVAARQLNGMLLESTIYPALLGHAVDLQRPALDGVIGSCVDLFLMRYGNPA
jgi:AcrR family transcriptional regulator